MCLFIRVLLPIILVTVVLSEDTISGIGIFCTKANVAAPNLKQIPPSDWGPECETFNRQNTAEIMATRKI